MHSHHFAQHQPGLDGHAGSGLQLDNLADLAFKLHWAKCHAWRAYQPRGQRFQACQAKFVNVRSHAGAAGVHGLRKRQGGKVPHELARGTCVAQAVFFRNAGKTDNWGRVIERSEEAVGRQVAAAVFVAGGNPANRAGSDNGVKRIVRQAMAVARFIEMNIVKHGATR